MFTLGVKKKHLKIMKRILLLSLLSTEALVTSIQYNIFTILR